MPDQRAPRARAPASAVDPSSLSGSSWIWAMLLSSADEGGAEPIRSRLNAVRNESLNSLTSTSAWQCCFTAQWQTSRQPESVNEASWSSRSYFKCSSNAWIALVLRVAALIFLDVKKDAGDVAPYRQSDTSPVLERLWLEKFHGNCTQSRQHARPHPRLLLMRAIAMVVFVHVHLLKNTPSITNRCCSLIPPTTTSDSRGTDVTASTVCSAVALVHAGLRSRRSAP